MTALMTAARAGYYPCVRLLVEHGSDARARTEAGYTALHAAAYQGDPAMISTLLKAGAPVNVAEDRGLTPLMMAVNSRSKDSVVVRMLLDRSAEPHAIDSSGRSVADWAAIGGRREIMAMLPGSRRSQTAQQPLLRPASPEKIRDAISKSVALLRETAPKFFPKAGCVSCHNVSIPMIALQAGEGRAVADDKTQAAIQRMAKHTIASLAPVSDNLLSGYCTISGVVTTASWALISLHGAGHAPDRITDSVVHCLMAEQFPNGRWGHGGGGRPPLSPEGGIPGTALVARAIQLYTPPALAAEVHRRIVNARNYLRSERPGAGDDYAFRLLGLFWTDGTESEIASAAGELLRRQRSDGGWAQTVDLPADAYATGQALTAISIAQPRLVNSEEYRRGVAYLMRTREADGSWHVRSRAFGFQPYFESGFPHGQDQWISMAATALMPAVDRPQWDRREGNTGSRLEP